MTSNDRDKFEPTDSAHVFVAIARKKDNGEESTKQVFRRIIRDYDKDLQVLRAICEKTGQTYRIYHTVNKRSFKKANKLFMHRLIDDIDNYYYRIDSLWKTCLMNEKSRHEKFFMVDVDSTDTVALGLLYNYMNTSGIEVMFTVNSPNGKHIITKPFDIRLIEHFNDYTTILKDGLYYVETVYPEVKNK